MNDEEFRDYIEYLSLLSWRFGWDDDEIEDVEEDDDWDDEDVHSDDWENDDSNES